MSNNLVLQCLLGMQCEDFTMIAADRIQTHSVLVMKDDVDKLFEISDKLVIGVNGEIADMVQFTQFVEKNLKLYKMKNKYELNTAAAVHFMRKTMTDGLRNANPYLLNTLVAGYDGEAGVQLYYMDFLAACVRLPYAAHGIGGYISCGVLDRYYKPNLSEPEAYEVFKLCVHEVQNRLFINLPTFRVKSVSKYGVKVLPTINPAMLIQK